MARLWVPQINEKPKNINSKRHQKDDKILDRFFLILDPFWEPTWNHVGYLSRPRTAQEASKTISRRLQDDPRCPQTSFGSPKTAQEASKPALEPSRPQFWPIVGPCLVHFWMMFDWFLIHFSLIFHFISMLKNKRFNIRKTTLWCSDVSSLCC